ncbi:16S rRNA (guanine(527)-N(7))-methyltransferase RsmG [Paenirhodobacter populi]|uniref:Ribosomal RNA small subunit methyltransferase G n=1 Tax=Paenirhodobacter populi TaxID=2306993 RepID=A0A443JBD9_9RHOB|nr:16S rRNA (guanine(527)-N(7))-methyltransferase RsmG [Sinirhodobacter populi]RWR17812.1 16S rRNA (guanine(527)-N(7))-methyltransferase RsmG [Sinirhodobacter populi]
MSEKAEFLKSVDVSRETLERLEGFEQLLIKWNGAINLVSPHTIRQIWSRHFLDSAQIFDLSEGRSGLWMDIGSGGGFPGLIVAILAAEKRPDLSVMLVESDRRKAAFLTTAAVKLGLKVTVKADRIEALPPANCDILSARALAPLSDLLGYAARHLAKDGICLFPKGIRWRDELAEAAKNWSFSHEQFPSLTDKDAVILKMKEPVHV